MVSEKIIGEGQKWATERRNRSCRPIKMDGLGENGRQREEFDGAAHRKREKFRRRGKRGRRKPWSVCIAHLFWIGQKKMGDEEKGPLLSPTQVREFRRKWATGRRNQRCRPQQVRKFYRRMRKWATDMRNQFCRPSTYYKKWCWIVFSILMGVSGSSFVSEVRIKLLEIKNPFSI